MNKKQQLDKLLNRPEPKNNEATASTSTNTGSQTETANETNEFQHVIDPAFFNQFNRSIRFDDIQNSFKQFNGKSEIDTWIQHFCEQSIIFRLNDLEKFVYAKKLMIDTAALWIRFESEATNFNELMIELREEFRRKTNNAVIHEKLRQTKKQQHETSMEYLYRMLETAAEGNIETKDVIFYTIQNLPGPMSAKSFMHDADTLKQFKRKLESFDNFQLAYCDVSKQNKKFDVSTGETNKIRANCLNCGDLHETISCPHKQRGPRCFNCNQFAHHLSKDCPNKTNDDNSTHVPRINIIRKNRSHEHSAEKIDQDIESHRHHQTANLSLQQKIDKALYDYEMKR